MSQRHPISDEEFAALFQSMPAVQLSKVIGLTERNVFIRRRAVEDRLGIKLTSASDRASPYEPRAFLDVKDGIVMVGSDAHIWPGPLTIGQRAWLKFLRKLKPQAQILNGDVFDFGRISRHPPIGWEKAPDVKDEMDAVKSFLSASEAAGGKKCQRFWALGNHDARFETRLASVAPEFRGVHGISLKDHYPNWTPCWSVEINGVGGVIVKHRFMGGTHATHNNTLYAGRSMCTAHQHSLKVTPFTDYNGTRYGIDCGCLCDPKSAQFSYAEDNPSNWRAGFVVLTFRDGQLMWPETVMVMDKKFVQFRGEKIRV